MRDKDLLRLLLQNGWKVVHINGSHHKLRKGNATEIISIHGKDVPSGLLNANTEKNRSEIIGGCHATHISRYHTRRS